MYNTLQLFLSVSIDLNCLGCGLIEMPFLALIIVSYIVPGYLAES